MLVDLGGGCELAAEVLEGGLGYVVAVRAAEATAEATGTWAACRREIRAQLLAWPQTHAAHALHMLNLFN